MKHRFQLISILIFSISLLIVAAVDTADIPKSNDNKNAVDIERNNGNNENNHSDDATRETENNKLLPTESIKSGDTTKNTLKNDKNKDTDNNESKLASNEPNLLSSNSDDTYDSLYNKPFTKLYDIGVGAYLENNWNDCIVYLEIAMHEFKVYRQATVNCRLQCAYQNERDEPFYQVPTEGLQFFDLMLKRTVCLSNCYKKNLKQQYLPPFFISQYYFERFLSMRPYEYLQLCYYRVS